MLDLTNRKKKIEYLKNLCYYLVGRLEVLNMPETLIKGIYDEASNYDNIDSSKIGFIDSVYYYRKLRKIIKNINLSKYLEKSKDKCNGKVVLIGTRIRPETVYYYYLNYCSEDSTLEEAIEKIKKAYPTLNEQLILMALLYTIKSKGIKVLL